MRRVSAPRASHAQRHRRPLTKLLDHILDRLPRPRKRHRVRRRAHRRPRRHSAECIPARARKTLCFRSARIAISKSSRPIRSSASTEDKRNLRHARRTRDRRLGAASRRHRSVRAAPEGAKESKSIGPTPGSRKRPDGRVLNWKTLATQRRRQRPVPIFHRVGRRLDASVHRRAARLHLELFEAFSRNKTWPIASPRRPVESRPRDQPRRKPHLHAIIAGPKAASTSPFTVSAAAQPAETCRTHRPRPCNWSRADVASCEIRCHPIPERASNPCCCNVPTCYTLKPVSE